MKKWLKQLWLKINPSYRNIVRTLHNTDAVLAQLPQAAQANAKLEQMSLAQAEHLSQAAQAGAKLGQLQSAADVSAEKVAHLQNSVDELSSKMSSYLAPQQERFTGHYEYWRAKRITAIVEHFGEEWFKGKKILELGCGYGDIGYVLMSLGAELVFAEGRAENCDYLRRRFPNNRVYFMNCENEWPFAEDERFDMILHMGLLYHLDNIWFVFDRCCHCCDHIVLETEVSDSDDENYILKIDENSQGWDQSLMGHGSRPSGAYVEKHLRSLGWSFRRVTDSRCNAQFHTYDWEVKNTGTWRNGLRRFWFCERGELSC